MLKQHKTNTREEATIAPTSLNFKPGSKVNTIYKLYFVENKTVEEIATITSYTRKSINDIKFYITNLQQSRTVTETTITTAKPQASSIPYINLKIFERGDKIILYVKANKEFEEYLQQTKEVRETTNLFGKRESGKFYYLQIVDNYKDDINSSIIHHGIINFAILRIPGISKGIEFDIDGLLTQEQLTSATKKLLSAFTAFYKSKIIQHKIDIEAEVRIENDN